MAHQKEGVNDSIILSRTTTFGGSLGISNLSQKAGEKGRGLNQSGRENEPTKLRKTLGHRRSLVARQILNWDGKR